MNELAIYSGLIIILGAIAWLSDREIRLSNKNISHTELLVEQERKRLAELILKQKNSLHRISQSYQQEPTEDIYLKDLWKGLFHDLMSPLTSISLYLERLNQKDINAEEARELVTKTVTSSRRMESFMASIKKSFNEKRILNQNYSVELNTELQGVTDLLAYKARMAGVAINIIYCESVIIRNINPIRIYQIFLNVISNAIESYEYSMVDDKQKTVDISVSKRLDQAQITITDHGCGMDESKITNLDNKVLSSKKNGTGLGLITVKNIINKELGGNINIKSTKNKGTIIEMNIPLLP